MTFQDWGVLSSRNRSLPLLPRVLESLLVSLVTTAVVFVASMVLGECRQMSSSSQIGNDSLLLQVTPVQLRPLSYVHKKDPGMRVVSLFRAAECAGRVVPCLIGLPRKGRVWPPFYVSQRAPSVSFTPPTEPAVTVNSGLSGLSLSRTTLCRSRSSGSRQSAAASSPIRSSSCPQLSLASPRPPPAPQ